MNKQELIIVLDFGGQYNELIARRVRDLNVYSLVLPYTTPINEIKKLKPKGIIFTGGPNSVYAKGAPSVDKKIFDLGIPILGICYGAQLMAHLLQGKVATAPVSEYGKTNVSVLTSNNKLTTKIKRNTVVFMSHTDYISKTPKSFKVLAKTKDCPCAAMANEEKKLYAVQFHPEVQHTVEGKTFLSNFLFNVCGCHKTWKMKDFVKNKITELKKELKNKKVLLALSGGVDSAVCAALLSKAIGKNLTCVMVDHGLMRLNEAKEVKTVFSKNYQAKFILADASKQFYNALKGVTDPEQKRKIIGKEFINVFEKQAKKIGKVDCLAQGTIYPDVIESGLGKSAVIKSHHNVGGLPKSMQFKALVEPLRMLFKDEVRKVGLELGLPKTIVYRQPFPGPGLGVRIVGEVTEKKVKILQKADFIYREEIAKAKLDTKIGQYFAALSNMRSVGVMGDGRTYDYAVVLRAVNTIDFMTAEVSEIPYNVLQKCMSRIINEVKGVNRVLYDITSKPPGTIELE